MELEPEESVKNQVEDLLHLVRGPLAASLEKLVSSAQGIPAGRDFHFYSNFSQFREPVANLADDTESLLRDIGASDLLWKQPFPWPADPDDTYDWLVNIQDELFDRADISMDEFKKSRKVQGDGRSGGLDDYESGFQLVYGKKRAGRNKTAAKGEMLPAVKMASKDKKTTDGRSRVPFHIPSIPRPQDRFNIFVDNSNTPFKHPGLQVAEDGSKFIHPLQAELNKLEFADKQSKEPQPIYPSPLESTPFKFIERVQDLKEMTIKLQSAGEVAVDLEHNQYRSFQGLTCLMQISTRSEDFVVDTLALHNYIGPYLRHIFANPAIKKVMHGADRDILWLQRDFGIYVCNLFDTGQASRVLQLERNSLEFLLQHFCGISAEKQYQTADWRLRPLPSEMLKYAREDTHYLLYIHDLMKQRLVAAWSDSGEAPLLEVYKRSRDVCLQLYEKELLTETSYLHIYGLQDVNFSPEQLLVVAGLYEWRDRIARIEDESTGYILPNKVLLQIAKKMPSNLDELRAFVKARHPFVERNLAAVLDVIKESRENMNKFQSAPKAAGQLSLLETSELKESLLTDNLDLQSSFEIVSKRNEAFDLQIPEEKVVTGERLDVKATSMCKNSVEMDTICGQTENDGEKANGASNGINVVAGEGVPTEFMIQEKAREIENIAHTEVKVASVKAQKRPARGLASMLGNSSSKQKSDDETRNKVEQIKSSVTLPFQSFSRSHETFSVMHSAEFKAVPTNENLHAEDVEVACDGDMSQRVEIEKDMPVLEKTAGIVKGEEGKRHRAWWPPLPDMGIRQLNKEINYGDLPPSLSELRRRSFLHGKQRSGHQPLEDIKQSKKHVPYEEACWKINDLFHDKKRKSPSPEAHYSRMASGEESRFKPFDYAAARRSMCFEITDKPARDINSFNANKNSSFSQKGKNFAFDPMNRVARESNADSIQPGKRRQVFPASGNRSATFR